VAAQGAFGSVWHIMPMTTACLVLFGKFENCKNYGTSLEARTILGDQTTSTLQTSQELSLAI